METRFKSLFAASLLMLFNTSLSQVAPDTSQVKAWDSFKQTNPSSWHIRWHEKTGTPASIYFGKTKPYSGTPEQASRAFLKENAPLTKMRPDISNLKLVHILSHNNINHVTFQETYNGIPVEGAEYQVHILSDGSIDMINGTYYSSITAPTVAELTGEAALKTVENDIGKSMVLRGSPATELVIVPDGDQFHLAWKISISTEEPHGAWTYFVDAINGKITSKSNDICFITGHGNVYPTHPNVSSVTNVPLYHLDGSGYLRGSYADVLNYVSSRADSSSNSFHYDPTDTHFDEVNLYEHIDLFRGVYLDSLGFNGLGSITATVHYDSSPGPNQSWFNPSTGQLYFGDGTPSMGIYDFAKEDKVIYHEYTHAVTNSIVYIQYLWNETSAINEGNSDYFAGSYTGRSVILDYAHPENQRDMNNPFISNYSQYNDSYYWPQYRYHEPHYGGQLWSACLWDLHNDSNIGPSVTDRVVLGGLYRITSTANFMLYSESIIAEDLATYGGAHAAAIQNCFAQRGIGWTGTIRESTTWSGIVSVTGSITVSSGVTLTVAQNTTVCFSSGASLIVNGTLIANGGSSSTPITFTAAGSTSPGAWGCIVLYGSGANGSCIQYANIQYGAEIDVENTSNVSIQHCNITNNSGMGLYFYNCTGCLAQY